MPPVLDAEVLRHRDLHAFDVVAVPDRLEHRVGEPQVEDLLQAHLSQVVVDPVQLGLVDVLVQFLGQGAGGGSVISERLLHHDPPRRGQASLGQALDDRAEQEGWDLQVEHRTVGALDRLGDPLVGRRVAEVALHVRQSCREAVEDGGIDRLPGALDRLAGALHQLVHRPVVDRNSDDRALQQPAPLEPVQRSERHHLRQVAGDPEDHEDVRGPLTRALWLAAPGVVWLSIVAVIVISLA